MIGCIGIIVRLRNGLKAVIKTFGERFFFQFCIGIFALPI